VLAAAANLDKAKALLVQAKADYERAATLAKQDSIAMQAVDLARAAYDSAAATVEASVAAVQQAEAQVNQKAGAVAVARTNLQYTVIRSPIDGTVVARNVDVGQTVAASLQAPTLFTIAQDLTKMQVYAKTDESNVGKVKVGRPVTFKVDAFPKDTFKGVVSQVRMNPVTVQNVVNYDAIIDFDNPELKLFPGMTAYVTIPVASADNTLKVPNGALRYAPRLSKATLEELQASAGIEAESGTVVWKLRPDNSVEPVRVALGITDHSYTVVTGVLNGELREGDELVTGAVPSKGRDSAGPPAGGPPRK
jgi:HlyD family secretion protein